MSAAVSLLDHDADFAPRVEAWTAFLAAVRVADDAIRRLDRLERGLVLVLDRIEATRNEIARAQALQIDALRLYAILRTER